MKKGIDFFASCQSLKKGGGGGEDVFISLKGDHRVRGWGSGDTNVFEKKKKKKGGKPNYHRFRKGKEKSTSSKDTGKTGFRGKKGNSKKGEYRLSNKVASGGDSPLKKGTIFTTEKEKLREKGKKRGGRHRRAEGGNSTGGK